LGRRQKMIVSPFYRKILVKDYDLPDSWTDELILTLKFLELNKQDNCSLTKLIREKNLNSDYKYEEHKIKKPYIIHEETAKNFQVISDLRNIFIEGFCELNKGHDYHYEEAYLRKIFLGNSGNFATMKKGQYVGSHDHPSIAFAIFYLTDVNNKADGGELILHDPAFHRNFGFHSPREIKVPTKKNRLVIGPSNIWHEVEMFTGNSERMCAVIDLRR
jgi:hypothetical protein